MRFVTTLALRKVEKKFRDDKKFLRPPSLRMNSLKDPMTKTRFDNRFLASLVAWKPQLRMRINNQLKEQRSLMVRTI